MWSCTVDSTSCSRDSCGELHLSKVMTEINSRTHCWDSYQVTTRSWDSPASWLNITCSSSDWFSELYVVQQHGREADESNWAQGRASGHCTAWEGQITGMGERQKPDWWLPHTSCCLACKSHPTHPAFEIRLSWSSRVYIACIRLKLQNMQMQQPILAYCTKFQLDRTFVD